MATARTKTPAEPPEMPSHELLAVVEKARRAHAQQHVPYTPPARPTPRRVPSAAPRPISTAEYTAWYLLIDRVLDGRLDGREMKQSHPHVHAAYTRHGARLLDALRIVLGKPRDRTMPLLNAPQSLEEALAWLDANLNAEPEPKQSGILTRPKAKTKPKPKQRKRKVIMPKRRTKAKAKAKAKTMRRS
jgi:hypothetical protein